MTSASIFRIIISEFSHRKKPSPIVLFVIDKNSEMSLHRTILSLGLAISLKVESSEEPLLDPKKIA